MEEIVIDNNQSNPELLLEKLEPVLEEFNRLIQSLRDEIKNQKR